MDQKLVQGPEIIYLNIQMLNGALISMSLGHLSLIYITLINVA